MKTTTFDDIEARIDGALNFATSAYTRLIPHPGLYLPVIGARILTRRSRPPIAVHVWPTVPMSECALFLRVILPTSSRLRAVSGSIIMVLSTGT